MAKKELFKIPLLSSLIKMLGAFPIDRGGGDVSAIKKAVEMLGEGKCVGMFPQGHRYPGEDPRKTSTKNGAALIFSRAQADVVPVYIWRKGNKPRLFRRTYIIIGEKIPFESFECKEASTAEYKRMTDIVFDKICALGESFDPKSLKEKKK
jgi:1-acyl-sn-glycerol-3-phosphate acyltransferase